MENSEIIPNHNFFTNKSRNINKRILDEFVSITSGDIAKTFAFNSTIFSKKNFIDGHHSDGNKLSKEISNSITQNQEEIKKDNPAKPQLQQSKFLHNTITTNRKTFKNNSTINLNVNLNLKVDVNLLTSTDDKEKNRKKSVPHVPKLKLGAVLDNKKPKITNSSNNSNNFLQKNKNCLPKLSSSNNFVSPRFNNNKINKNKLISSTTAANSSIDKSTLNRYFLIAKNLNEKKFKVNKNSKMANEDNSEIKKIFKTYNFNEIKEKENNLRKGEGVTTKLVPAKNKNTLNAMASKNMNSLKNARHNLKLIKKI
jgi:hypothetical protein